MCHQGACLGAVHCGAFLGSPAIAVSKADVVLRAQNAGTLLPLDFVPSVWWQTPAKPVSSACQPEAVFRWFAVRASRADLVPCETCQDSD